MRKKKKEEEGERRDGFEMGGEGGYKRWKLRWIEGCLSPNWFLNSFLMTEKSYYFYYRQTLQHVLQNTIKS